MKRIEIVTNQAIEEDILEALEIHGMGECYTLIPHIHGRGEKGTRLGTALWPEENCLFILFVKDESLSTIRDIIQKIREKFPREGTVCFVSPLEEEF